jgi:hypothetical protein
VLARHPEVTRVAANAGHGNPQIYYNVHAGEERSHIGELFVQIAHFDSNETPALLDAIRAELGVYPRAQIRLESFRNGPPLDAPIVVRVFAEDLGVLRGLSARVAEQVSSVPGTLYTDDPLRVTKTDLAVRVDAEQAGRLGVPEIEVKNGVRLAIAGLLAGKLRDSDGEEYPIRVTLQQGEGERASLTRSTIHRSPRCERRARSCCGSSRRSSSRRRRPRSCTTAAALRHGVRAHRHRLQHRQGDRRGDREARSDGGPPGTGWRTPASARTARRASVASAPPS